MPLLNDLLISVTIRLCHRPLHNCLQSTFRRVDTALSDAFCACDRSPPCLPGDMVIWMVVAMAFFRNEQLPMWFAV